MRKRWIAFLLLCGLLLAVGIYPSTARVSEGNFDKPVRKTSQAASPAYVYYRAQPGDTLWGIAQQKQIGLQSLMKLNRMNEKSVLEAGAMVKIPADEKTVYTVRAGDTLWKIARQYRIGLQELADANQGLRIDHLEIGQKIGVPTTSSTVSREYEQPSRNLSGIRYFAWPVIGTITSPYGWRSSGFHHGLDIAADENTPIRAAAAGQVIFAGVKPIYGRMVIIQHSDGWQTVYAHSSKLLVKKGQKIAKGQEIAKVGMSGNATGPHLHFEVRYQNRTFNPINYLR